MFDLFASFLISFGIVGALLIWGFLCHNLQRRAESHTTELLENVGHDHHGSSERAA